MSHGGRNMLISGPEQSSWGSAVPDVDAEAFINTVGILTDDEKTYIRTLVDRLKDDGIWSKMRAIYPMIGGTEAIHKFNLKDPRDADDAFRLTFFGGWTHSATGALPNGTNAYADTHLVNRSEYTEAEFTHISYYSRNETSTSNNYVAGANDSGAATEYFLLRTNLRLYVQSNPNNGDNVISAGGGTTIGYFTGTIFPSGDGAIFHNGINITAGAPSDSDSVKPNIPIYLGALNGTSGAGNYSTAECAFADFGLNLSAVECTNLYNAVQAFQTSLGRQVI